MHGDNVKIEIIDFSNIKNEALLKAVLAKMEEVGVKDFAISMSKYNTDNEHLDAEIAVNSLTKGVLDLRLKDNRNRITNVSKYDIGFSEWLLNYRDEENRNVMDIYLQDRIENFITYVGDSEYRVYISDLKEHWIEENGEDSWHDDDYPTFDEIDSDIQTQYPELYFESRETDYLTYTTELKYAYGLYIVD